MPGSFVLATLASLALMLLFLAAPTSSAAATASPSIFGGDAFGSTAFTSARILSGKSAWSVLSCGTAPGARQENTRASVSRPPYTSTGTVSTYVMTFETTTSTGTRSVAVTQNARLLNGLIKADTVRAQSLASRDATGYHTSGYGSRFTNLTIAGRAMPNRPARNTTVTLPGIGRVVLNEQTGGADGDSAELTVNMIHAYVTSTNSLGIAVGTEIIVSHARSSLAGAIGPLGGKAFGSKVTVGDTVRSGRTAIVWMPCLGTNDKLRSNTTSTSSSQGVFRSGTVLDTARGLVAPTESTGELVSNVKNLNLLKGRVTADLIKADAHATKTSAGRAFSDLGSRFGGLVVQGHPALSQGVPRNTKVFLQGLGDLWLHRVVRTPTSIEVRMIELQVTRTNSYGLPVGTNVKIGVSTATVR